MSARAAVAQFCAQLGLPQSPMPIALSFERSGSMHIEERDGAVVVTLTRTVPLHQAGVAEAALRAVHPDQGLPFPVRAAFDGEDRLVLLAKVPDEQLDLPALDALARLLSRLATDVLSSAR